MDNFNDMQKAWEQMDARIHPKTAYDEQSLETIIKQHGAGYLKKSVRYFWASLVLQIIVYSLLTHVFIRYFWNNQVRYLSLAGILLLLPFTTMLMRKFKSFATVSRLPAENGIVSAQRYLTGQKTHLENFYAFKKWYELFLVPLTLAIAFVLSLQLYAPEVLTQHLPVATIAYLIVVAGYSLFLRIENGKYFRQPLKQLSLFLKEFEN